MKHHARSLAAILKVGDRGVVRGSGMTTPHSIRCGGKFCETATVIDPVAGVSSPSPTAGDSARPYAPSHGWEWSGIFFQTATLSAMIVIDCMAAWLRVAYSTISRCTRSPLV